MMKTFKIFLLFGCLCFAQTEAKEQNYQFFLEDNGEWCLNIEPNLCLSKEYQIHLVDAAFAVRFETQSETTSEAYYKGRAKFWEKKFKPKDEMCVEIKPPLKLISRRKFLGFETILVNLKGKNNLDFGMFVIDIGNGCLLITPKYEPSWEYLSEIVFINK